MCVSVIPDYNRKGGFKVRQHFEEKGTWVVPYPSPYP